VCVCVCVCVCVRARARAQVEGLHERVACLQVLQEHVLVSVAGVPQVRSGGAAVLLGGQAGPGLVPGL
jgi:hypothetical protein